MIVYLPLEHIEQRYTTHLDRDILAYLKQNDIQHIYLTPNVLSNEIKNGSFLDADNTIYRQFSQFMQLIEGLLNGTIPKDSTLFVSDIWNFGILCIPYLNFFSNYNLKVTGVLHAGSFTDTDFVRQMERHYKGMEDIIFDICDKIFVGSEFIKEDILRKRFVHRDKIEVTGLPLDYLGMNQFKNNRPKEDIVIFNGRNVDEKQPYLFDLLQTKVRKYQFINTQDLRLSKEAYYHLLSKSKVVVSFALQENFGYGIQEAVYLGCEPVLPNRLCYVEQFKKSALYDTFDDCVFMVEKKMEKPGQHYKQPESRSNNNQIFKKWFQ